MTRLRYERMRREWTQVELAQRAHIDPALLSRIETGRVLPYAPALERLARAFGMAPGDAPQLIEEIVPPSLQTTR